MKQKTLLLSLILTLSFVGARASDDAAWAQIDAISAPFSFLHRPADAAFPMSTQHQAQVDAASVLIKHLYDPAYDKSFIITKLQELTRAIIIQAAQQTLVHGFRVDTDKLLGYLGK